MSMLTLLLLPSIFFILWVLLMYLTVMFIETLEASYSSGQVRVFEVPETPEETWMRAYQEHCALHNMPNEMSEEWLLQQWPDVEQSLHSAK